MKRGLSGDTSTMPLRDLVSYLGDRRATGTLYLERGTIQKQVWIQEGMVVSASSNQPREYLGQFLINMGHLTEDQFMKAYQTQKETKIFLGKILVMIGLVSEQLVASALSLKLRETILEGFIWGEDGSFVFDPNEPAPAFDGLDVKVDLRDVQREGEFRETAWRAIRGVFPDGRLRLLVNEPRFPVPVPGSMDERLLAMIKERHRIDDMILALHANDFFLYQRLYALYRLDAVRVDRSAPPVEPEAAGGATVGEEQSPEDVARHAEMYLRNGSPREAEALARRAFELQPTPEHRTLLNKCEKALVVRLREDLAGTRVPSVLVAPVMLKTMTLSAPEKYLLSKIDGRRNMASIISVSPLQELEALKLFQQFIDGGLVALR